ncbi:MAG TPA: hypothetical protein PLQ81_13800, partial [bacterium]|nr:hypothetical protein [bacterium]
NMTGAVLFNNDIIKYFSFSDTFAISIWPDSVFKNVKYVSADSFYVYIYNDVDNIINAYNRQGTLVNVMRTGLDSKTKLKKFFIKNGYIYLIPKKPSGDFSAINLQTGEIETPFIMRDLALTTNACYRIAADKDKYYYADFEKNSIISLAINEKTTDKYVIDVLSVNSKSMFPHIIENLKIRDVYGNSIMNINESHFEAFEGFSRFSDPEISGFHNFAANSNRDSTIEFRTNYLAKPISIKPTDKYNSENNLIVVIDNCPELLKELKYVKSFLSDLAGKLNFFKYKLDLWGTMGERIEKFLSNSTDKFEFNRISERLLSADNKNSLNLTDAIEEVSERVYDYAGIKTIIFITSNNSDKRFELNEKTKKLIRFMRNNDINIEIINFNRDDYAEGIDLSRFFNDRYHQFPDIAFTKCLENIEYYKPSNYTLFYKTKLAKAPAYTWINQFLFLKYLNNISESRCGFFIP